MRFCASGLSVVYCVSQAVAAEASSPVILDPHRAVYDLSLGVVREEGAIDSAVGRIALEIHGDACDGFTTRVRQVLVVDAEGGSGQTIDSNSATFESADGDILEFRSETRALGTTLESVDGRAARADAGTTIALGRADVPTRVIEGRPYFPTEHVRLMIEGARAGERLLPARLFDGSGDGLTVYDTLALIGPARAPENEMEDETEKQAQGEAAPTALAPVADLVSWPVRLSYFAEGRGELLPEFEISFRLFENGVSSDLVFDFGGYALEGRLVALEMLPKSADCATR